MTKRVKIFVVSLSSFVLGILLLGAVLGKSSAADGDAYRHFAVFTDVISRIKSDYVEEPDMKNVTLGALNGMLESIDPYASYLNADQYKQYVKTKESKKA
ncbi:MAG: carboxyl-terminal protease, partial [Bryobacterales bacterium]|nr:carboxyl-terminal protease [Bryobacterales bacterium]